MTGPSTITIVLDCPPSLNNAFINVKRGGRVKSKRYREWCNAAHFSVIASVPLPRRVSPPYSVRVSVPIGTRADIDNLIKPLFDVMQRAGVMTNDREVVEVLARKNLVTPGHCVVTVQTCGRFI